MKICHDSVICAIKISRCPFCVCFFRSLFMVCVCVSIHLSLSLSLLCSLFLYPSDILSLPLFLSIAMQQVPRKRKMRRHILCNGNDYVYNMYSIYTYIYIYIHIYISTSCIYIIYMIPYDGMFYVNAKCQDIFHAPQC